jgi:hypothetical protein
MHERGSTTREIEDVIGLSHVTISKRIKSLGLPTRGRPVNREGGAYAPPPHLAAHMRAKRGFHVPAHLESKYFELIKSGVPIADACRRLNISA